MHWNDTGILMATRQHGEGALVATFLTRDHGCHAGLIRGGASRKNKSHYQIGNIFTLTWKARLSEHLGQITAEPVQNNTAKFFHDAAKLHAVVAACALAHIILPERHPYPDLYDQFIEFLHQLPTTDWRPLYVNWELSLLTALGYGLDLRTCAVTGQMENLTHISPKTGRAVCHEAAAPYLDKLLPLPACLTDHQAEDWKKAFDVNAFFMDRHLLHPYHKTLPPPRRLLENYLAA